MTGASLLQWLFTGAPSDIELLRPRRTVLTHMGLDMDWSWLCRELPSGIEPGFDGQVIDIDAG